MARWPLCATPLAAACQMGLLAGVAKTSAVAQGRRRLAEQAPAGAAEVRRVQQAHAAANLGRAHLPQGGVDQHLPGGGHALGHQGLATLVNGGHGGTGNQRLEHGLFAVEPRGEPRLDDLDVNILQSAIAALEGIPDDPGFSLIGRASDGQAG